MEGCHWRSGYRAVATSVSASSIVPFIMIACQKHNDSLLGVFYSFFHNIEGPKLAAKYPPE